eukprot:CAMPEP_0197074974 /NCGR_PEP_ID=MMETSP1384-20130603/211377_1 /TAXON_ID=29189 /ORGANISM="Ammonia sp." /LENGTH=866 /DNA_ID=CAMNT_0042513817 /DNA_START=10 /DNA_END=2611 /DNA_ORIENTATION=+
MARLHDPITIPPPHKQEEKGNAQNAEDAKQDEEVVDADKAPSHAAFQHSFSLKFRTLDGKIGAVKQALPNESVLSLKRKIEEQIGLKTDSQRLVFKGKILSDDDARLQDYHLSDGAEVVIMERLPASSRSMQSMMMKSASNMYTEKESEKIICYSRQTIEDRMSGGALEEEQFAYLSKSDLIPNREMAILLQAILGTLEEEQFAYLTKSDLIPNREMAILLQAYPHCNEVWIWDWKQVERRKEAKKMENDENMADEADEESSLRLGSASRARRNNNSHYNECALLSKLGTNWSDMVHGVGNNELSRCMKIIPTLSLRSIATSTFVLTLDCSGNLCCTAGAEKGHNNRRFWLPLYRAMYTSDIDELANSINQLNLNMDLMFFGGDDESAIDSRQPLEAIMVCFDRSGSMSDTCFRDNRGMTRLDVVKEYWEAFLNRSKAYDYANHIGLVLFDSRIEVTCKLSPLYERFSKKINEIQTRGCTALRDAIQEAAKQLIDWKLADLAQRKNANLRIIALTDGEDNQSSINDLKLTQILLSANIVCDAILIGNHNYSLHSICSATGGYVFYPHSLRDGLRIFELETFLSTTERGDIEERKSSVYICNESQLQKWSETALDVCDVDNVPKGKVIENLQQNNKTVDLETKMEKMKKLNDGEHAHRGWNSKQRTRRVVQEMSNILRDPHPFWDIYVEESNLFFWKLVLCGPIDTPYQGGVYLLYMQFAEEYPEKPPKMRFITPIKHVNVNSYGRICHSVFDRNYQPDTKVRDILDNVFGLLLEPDWDDPLDSVLRQEYADNKHKFRESVCNHTIKHAMLVSREDYKRQLSQQSQAQSQLQNIEENENERESEKAHSVHHFVCHQNAKNISDSQIV